MLYSVLLFVHLVGAAVLLGTGSGIAFFMLLGHRTGNPVAVAEIARIVVIADFVFTTSAVVVQPITGVWLALHVGYPLSSHWIVTSIALYLLIGVFWLPVVWMQIRMRRLAADAAARGEPLPSQYRRLFRLWFASGFPAFGALLLILWLMITKPTAIW